MTRAFRPHRAGLLRAGLLLAAALALGFAPTPAPEFTEGARAARPWPRRPCPSPGRAAAHNRKEQS